MVCVMGDTDQHLVKGLPLTVNGRHAFVHERVLLLIARKTMEDGSVSFRKKELAAQLGCCDAMLDRAIARLRRSGEVVSTPTFTETGSQLANRYHATERGLASARVMMEMAREH